MGRGTLDGFMTAYEDSCGKISGNCSRYAVIFVQGIMKVAKEKVIKIRSLTMWGSEQRNERIAALADGKKYLFTLT